MHDLGSKIQKLSFIIFWDEGWTSVEGQTDNPLFVATQLQQHQRKNDDKT